MSAKNNEPQQQVEMGDDSLSRRQCLSKLILNLPLSLPFSLLRTPPITMMNIVSPLSENRASALVVLTYLSYAKRTT